MAQPTLVSATASTFTAPTTSTPLDLTGISVQAGDLVLVSLVVEDSARTITPSTSGYTYTARFSAVVATRTRNYIWTATAPSTATITVSTTSGGSTDYRGFVVYVFRNWSSFGTPGSVSSGTASTFALTTTGANSTVVMVAGDWDANDGASRTRASVNSSTGTEDAYDRDVVHMTSYFWHHDDVGAAGAKTVGLTAPSGSRWMVVGIEVLGSASAPPVGRQSINPKARSRAATR